MLFLKSRGRRQTESPSRSRVVPTRPSRQTNVNAKTQPVHSQRRNRRRSINQQTNNLPRPSTLFPRFRGTTQFLSARTRQFHHSRTAKSALRISKISDRSLPLDRFQGLRTVKTTSKKTEFGRDDAVWTIDPRSIVDLASVLDDERHGRTRCFDERRASAREDARRRRRRRALEGRR